MNQTRAGEFDANIDGQSLTADQIYSRIRGGVGNGDLVVAQDVTDRLVERYSERSAQLKGLVDKLDAAWQGDAAEAAASHTTPLDRSFRESASSLQQVKDALRDQIGSFSSIYGAVEPVPAEPPRSGFLNDVNPFTTDTDRAIEAYNKNAANNVARYQVYNADSVANGDRMPTAYPSLPLDVPPISVGDTSGNGRVGTATGEGVTGTSAVSPSGTAAPHERAANPSQVAPAPDPRGQGQVGAPPVGTDSGTTRPSRLTPTLPPTTGESGTPPWNPSVTGPSAGPGLVPPVAGAPHYQRTGGGAGRDARGGSATGAIGAGDGRRDATGQPGRGPAAGIGDPANAARRGATPIAGAAGTAGIGGMPYGAQPAGARDDDDIEHKSVLIQPDPDELFGLLDPLPPPVIGEDRGA